MSHTILLADDSVTIQKIVEIVFHKEPFTVVRCGNGDDAIQKARELRPSVVLADHMMPGKSGYEVAEALKADPATAGIPVMILAGNTAPYDENRAKAAGVVGHVPKPFDCQTLLDRVRNVLGIAAPAPGAMPAGAPRPAVPATAVAPAGGLPRPPGGTGAPPLPRPQPFGAPAAQPVAAAPAAAQPAFAQAAAQPAPQPVNPAAQARPAVTQQMFAVNPQPQAAAARPASLDPFGFGLDQKHATPQAAQPQPQPQAAAAPQPAYAGAPAMTQQFAAAGAQPAARPAATQAFAGFPAQAAPTPAQAVAAQAAAAQAQRPAPSIATTAPVMKQATAQAALAEISLDSVDLVDVADVDDAGPAAAVVSRATERVAQQAKTELAAKGGQVSDAALTQQAKDIIERIAWEIVPELAETIIREEIQRLLKA